WLLDFRFNHQSEAAHRHNFDQPTRLDRRVAARIPIFALDEYFAAIGIDPGQRRHHAAQHGLTPDAYGESLGPKAGPDDKDKERRGDQGPRYDGAERQL